MISLVPNACPPVRLSFADTLNRVLQQVEYDCFADTRFRYIDPLYKELCLIIAEVFVMNPNSVIKVNGAETQANLVQEIYSRLRHDHIRLVFSNFHEVSCRVFNKRAYLRTALYNAVFELESFFANGGSFD